MEMSAVKWGFTSMELRTCEYADGHLDMEIGL